MKRARPLFLVLFLAGSFTQPIHTKLTSKTIGGIASSAIGILLLKLNSKKEKPHILPFIVGFIFLANGIYLSTTK